MRLIVDPPMSQWRPMPRRPPIIATGHQASLWHPGILAKDIAADVAADRLGATVHHLVVNHDVHDAVSLAAPVQRGEALGVERVVLGPQRQDVPTGFQPAVDPGAMRAALVAARRKLGAGLVVDLDPLIEAIARVGPQPNLAAQMSRITADLMQPYAGQVTLVDATDLLRDAWDWLRRPLLEDARRCVRFYNQAVAIHPGAGLTPLIEERDRVELPLWRVGWGRRRRRVHADLADSRRTILAGDDGEPIGDDELLAPRALLMTAIARTAYSLFIHGKGGGVYDRVTERWWSTWMGRPLAPRTVVSADVTLDFDAPVADRADLDKAVWFRHHLPHNVDRVLHVDGPITAEKRALLAHMDDDRDKARRARAYRRLKQLNADLVREHPAALAEADQRLRRARLGMRNAAVATRRDWCFALYPPSKLQSLRRAIEQA